LSSESIVSPPRPVVTFSTSLPMKSFSFLWPFLSLPSRFTLTAAAREE
jgi:hypothetical protein